MTGLPFPAPLDNVRGRLGMRYHRRVSLAQVDHQDPALALMAVKCCFDLLAGPSASLNVDLAWLADALVDVVQRALPNMSRGTVAGQWYRHGGCTYVRTRL